jgi:hypothetical protein
VADQPGEWLDVTALHVNALICLLGFVSEREIGWYVTLAAHVVATAKGRL